MAKNTNEKVSSFLMTSKSSQEAGSINVENTRDLDITKMITRERVAQYLKVSIQTVINYTNRGLLVAHKIGRRVLYNEDEVKAAIQSCAVKRYQHESTRLYVFSKQL